MSWTISSIEVGKAGVERRRDLAISASLKYISSRIWDLVVD